MKILLIRPPARYFKGASSPSAGLPLGLLYIAGVLEENGHTVEIYDAQINVDVPFFCEPDRNMHMGDRWEVVGEEIRRRNPGLIGITNTFTTQFDNAVRVAEIVKKVNNGIPVVVGGNHPTVNPEDFFRRTEAVDIVCMGEGEYTMLEIASACTGQKGLKDISGTAVREGGEVKINNPRQYIQDLDTLPFPAYHLIDLERYFFLNRKGFSGRPVWRYPGVERAVSVITSRGCPFNCIFCSISLHIGKKWRCHSSAYVLRHIEFLVDKYKIRHVHFEDDNLTLDMERFKEILDGLIKRKMDITWGTPNGVRADTMTEELLKSSRESGCVYIILGVESGDQRVLSKIVDKHLNLEKVVKTAGWCKEAGIDAMAFFVIGFPGETLNDMKKTTAFALELMKKYDVSPTVFVATPLIGTRLYRICKEKGYLREEPSGNNLAITTGGGGKTALIETEDFGPDEITAVIRKFIRGYKIIFAGNLIGFFLKNPGIMFRFMKRLWMLRSEIGFKQALLELVSFKNCLIVR